MHHRSAQTLTVALDLPSAQVLADQIATIQDLQFVMECCKRLLTELVTPEDERDPVVPQALWSAALIGLRPLLQQGQAVRAHRRRRAQSCRSRAR